MAYKQLALLLHDNADALVLNKAKLDQVANGVTQKRLPMVYGEISL